MLFWNAWLKYLYKSLYSSLITSVAGKSSFANNSSNSARVTLFEPSHFSTTSFSMLSGTFNESYGSRSSSSGPYIVKNHRIHCIPFRCPMRKSVHHRSYVHNIPFHPTGRTCSSNHIQYHWGKNHYSQRSYRTLPIR